MSPSIGTPKFTPVTVVVVADFDSHLFSSFVCGRWDVLLRQESLSVSGFRPLVVSTLLFETLGYHQILIRDGRYLFDVL